MLLIGAALFCAIAADVLRHGRLAQADQALAPYLHEHTTYWLVFLAAGFSGLGQFWFLFPLALAVGIWLYRRRQWRALAAWSIGLVGSTVICVTLKNIFAFPRPTRFSLYTFHSDTGDLGYTFPSGHTMGAVIAAGLLALLWMHLRPRPAAQRLAAAALVALLGLLVGASLLYIGVHYLTDILGALAVSLAWLGVLRWILPPANSRPKP